MTSAPSWSRQRKSGGTSGGVEAGLTPMSRNVTPARASGPTSPRVWPGTSVISRRWSSSRIAGRARRTAPGDASTSARSSISVSQLNGRACQARSSAATPAPRAAAGPGWPVPDTGTSARSRSSRRTAPARPRRAGRRRCRWPAGSIRRSSAGSRRLRVREADVEVALENDVDGLDGALGVTGAAEAVGAGPSSSAPPQAPRPSETSRRSYGPHVLQFSPAEWLHSVLHRTVGSCPR